METYVVKQDVPKLTLKQRAVVFLFLAGAYFVVMLAVKTIWPASTSGNHGLMSIMPETAVVSVLWGLLMVFFIRPKLPSYKLQVDENSITAITEYQGWMKRFLVKRIISKGKIRSSWNVHRSGELYGSAYSDRSKLAARMWGFVLLPKALPEYEALRDLAESWRER